MNPTDEQAVRRALGIAEGAALETEDLSTPRSAITRITWRDSSGIGRAAVLKSAREGLLAYNEAAILEALAKVPCPYAPRVLGFVGEMVLLEWVEGATATALLPPPGAIGAAMDALAALHRLDLREGMRWGMQPDEVLDPEVPLYRLGYAMEERERAAVPLREAQALLRESPWGFCHWDATSANALLRDDAATFTGWGRAGFGPQYFDVAAFLLTSGLTGAERRHAAMRYGAAAGRQPLAVADEIDVAGLLWSFEWLLRLPRQQIAVMGDDAASEELVILATRVERASRESAGGHPAAAALRAALWPS